MILMLYKVQQEAAKPVDELPTINPELLLEQPVRLTNMNLLMISVHGLEHEVHRF